MRHCYSLFSYALVPLVLCRLWWRGIKAPAYRQRIAERFGHIKLADTNSSASPVLWLHAVSVGETMAAKPLIDEILQQYPQHRLLVTTTTPTGSAQLRRLYGDDQLAHCYFPYDLPHVVARFLNRVKPELVVIMETELWPNLYHQCAQQQIPILLANARLSEKSLAGYQKISALARPTLQKLDFLAAQSALDLQRFLTLGADSERSAVCGNLKYQISISDETTAQARELHAALGERRIWVAASTHAGEDEIALAVQQQLLAQNPSALLILVPRHPERFNQVATLCAASDLSFVRRSQQRLPSDTDSVWLSDTMGELLLMYGVAEFSFIGGSMVPTGGHNPLEPAAFSVASIVGPHTFNFTDVVATMQQAKSITQVDNEAALIDTAIQWMQSPELANQQGRAARQVLDDNLGAVPCLLEHISKLVKQA